MPAFTVAAYNGSMPLGPQVRCSMLEIFRNEVSDLLMPGSGRLQASGACSRSQQCEQQCRALLAALLHAYMRRLCVQAHVPNPVTHTAGAGEHP